MDYFTISIDGNTIIIGFFYVLPTCMHITIHNVNYYAKPIHCTHKHIFEYLITTTIIIFFINNSILGLSAIRTGEIKPCVYTLDGVQFELSEQQDQID